MQVAAAVLGVGSLLVFKDLLNLHPLISMIMACAFGLAIILYFDYQYKYSTLYVAAAIIATLIMVT